MFIYKLPQFQLLKLQQRYYWSCNEIRVNDPKQFSILLQRSVCDSVLVGFCLCTQLFSIKCKEFDYLYFYTVFDIKHVFCYSNYITIWFVLLSCDTSRTLHKLSTRYSIRIIISLRIELFIALLLTLSDDDDEIMLLSSVQKCVNIHFNVFILNDMLNIKLIQIENDGRLEC